MRMNMWLKENDDTMLQPLPYYELLWHYCQDIVETDVPMCHVENYMKVSTSAKIHK